MSEPELHPRPDGEVPRVNQPCPLCDAQPYHAHEPNCPWQLWAENPKRNDDRDT